MCIQNYENNFGENTPIRESDRARSRDRVNTPGGGVRVLKRAKQYELVVHQDPTPRFHHVVVSPSSKRFRQDFRPIRESVGKKYRIRLFSEFYVHPPPFGLHPKKNPVSRLSLFVTRSVRFTKKGIPVAPRTVSVSYRKFPDRRIGDVVDEHVCRYLDEEHSYDDDHARRLDLGGGLDSGAATDLARAGNAASHTHTQRGGTGRFFF